MLGSMAADDGRDLGITCTLVMPAMWRETLAVASEAFARGSRAAGARGSLLKKIQVHYYLK